MASTRRLAWSFAALTALTYVLVVFGAVVRLQGAGLSCPDWPLCLGELVPSMSFGVVFEVGHRYLASLVSLGLVGLTIWTCFLPAARKVVGRWLVAAFVVLVVQIVLGGLTVLQLLASWTVTSHLVCGNAFALVLALISVRLFALDAPARSVDVPPLARPLVALTAVLLVAQMAIGGLVAATFAGQACVTWPACVGTDWFPSWTGPIGLHIFHRLTAYALAVAVLGLAGACWKSDGLGRITRFAAVLVLAQVALGVANVVLHLPSEISAAHSLGAAMLCLVVGLVVDRTFFFRPAAVEPAPLSMKEAA